jgi:AraC-like DNA-binding protein
MQILDSVYIYRLIDSERLIWHGRYHSHKAGEFEIHFFLEGDGEFLANRKNYEIGTNVLFVSCPHEFHSIVPKMVKKPLTYYAILFKLSETEDGELYQLLINAQTNNKKKIIDDANIRFTLDDIMRLSLSTSEGLKKAASLLLSGCLYKWYAKDDMPEQLEMTSSKSRAHVSKALRFMEKHVYENLQVEDMAEALNLSTEHLIRLFHTEMQMTPYQYFMRLKILTASAVLTNSDKSIADVASELSFENQFHFSKVFKKCTGLTPSSYRVYYAQK